MGYFSWLTADTEESILVGEEREVFLLQPNGEEAIVETCYDGYGRIGYKDAFHWVTEHSLPLCDDEEGVMSDETKRNVGILLSSEGGSVYRDKESGNYIASSFWSKELLACVGCKEVRLMFVDGSVINRGVESGTLIDSTSRFFKELGITIRPLKFSFSKDAVYEELPASKTCPNQGLPEE